MDFILEETEPKTLILADIKVNEFFIYKESSWAFWGSTVCVKLADDNGKNTYPCDKIFNFNTGIQRLGREVAVRKVKLTKVHYRLAPDGTE